MGKKDKGKKDKAQKKARVAEKAERKQSKKQAKQTKRAGNKAEPEEDIETILERLRQEQEDRYKIIEEVVDDPPSRRANASLTASPIANEILLFGGEFYNGDRLEFYKDFYRYSVEKQEWRRITSPNSPGPRSSHQVAAFPNGDLFLLGGEFASANETQFFHYKDFWRMDLRTNAWERLDARPKPSARSGHRMVAWKNFLVCFGGFYDNGIKVEYYGDLWVFDIGTYKWTRVDLVEPMQRPSARSGFQFISTTDGVLLYGGYFKEVIKGQKPKGVVHTDMWFLKMNADIKLIKWERRKRAGIAPSPRAGCTMAAYKNRAILFGGVYDTEVSDERLDSVCFNEMFTYQMDSKRWYPLNLRKPARKKRTETEKRRALKPNEKHLETAVTVKECAHEEYRSIFVERDGDLDDSDNECHWDDAVRNVAGQQTNFAEGDEIEQPESPAAEPPVAPEVNTKLSSALGGEDSPVVPCPRYNAMMCIQRNTLFLYGGILEHENKEYTLDDFFTFNMDKPSEFTALRTSEIDAQDWFGENSDDEENGDDDDDDEEDDGDDDEDEDDEDDEDEVEVEGREVDEDMTPNGTMQDNKANKERQAGPAGAEADGVQVSCVGSAYGGVTASAGASQEDILRTPQPGENMRSFYARTSEYWTRIAFENGSTEVGKALRQMGFRLAKERYDGYKPVLDEMEQLRLEAMDGEDTGSSQRATSGGTSRNRR